jgi:hypothetical protein
MVSETLPARQPHIGRERPDPSVQAAAAFVRSMMRPCTNLQRVCAVRRQPFSGRERKVHRLVQNHGRAAFRQQACRGASKLFAR